MKAYIFLFLGILATFAEAAVQRQYFGNCDRDGRFPEGQEAVYDRDRYSMPRCRCAKIFTPFQRAEENGGGCVNHVASCKQCDQISCHYVTGDDCTREDVDETFNSQHEPYQPLTTYGDPGAALGSDIRGFPAPGNRTGIPERDNNSANSYCRIFEPLCEIEKIVELCDQRYITFTHECTKQRKIVDIKNEAKCKQAQEECKSEAYFANSCSTLLQVCSAADIVEYCKAGQSRNNIPEDTCNDYRVRLGIETVPATPASFRRASDRECVSYKQQCIDGNNSACSLVIRQCDQKYMNELCKAGKISDIYRCNVARANSEGPSYYCGQYLNKCFFFNGQDCDFALRYCDSNTITSKCAALGRSSKLCTNFKNLTSGEKYSQDKCYKYTRNCNYENDSMACKEVIYHCGTDMINGVCRKPSIWTDYMCKEVKARLNLGGSSSSSDVFKLKAPQIPAPVPGGFHINIGFP